MGHSDATVAPEDTRELIMEATYRALATHGYKDLRMRDIGEEMETTRQVIPYHFDGKQDLIASFLEYIADQYEGSAEVDRGADPRDELAARVDQCLSGPGSTSSPMGRMMVYHEVFAYAQHDEHHQEVFNEHYADMRDSIVTVVQDGIDQGIFQETDPEPVGQLITDVIHVARSRKISLGQDEAPEQARDAVQRYIDRSLDPRSNRG